MMGTPIRLIALAGTLAVAGCAAATSTGGGVMSGGSSTSSGQVSTAISTTSATDVAHRLLDLARVPSGAVRTGTAPTHSLASPPDGQSAPHPIILMRWWRVSGSWTSAYAWLSHHQSKSLSSLGGSSSGGPAASDREQAADFTMPHLPSTVNSAELSVAVAPLGPNSTAIGVFVTVVRQPPRSNVEDVPATVDTVTVITRRTTGTPDGQILGRRTVTGAEAQRLVEDFNALTVQPPGEIFSCPLSFITQTAIFHSGTHTWIATAGVCVGVTVTLDGTKLPTLNASDQFSRDLRAAYGKRFPGRLLPQPLISPGGQTANNQP